MVLGSLILFTQTRFFKNWLRDKLLTTINQVVYGQVEIGLISGNFITNFEISDILLTTNKDTILHLPKFKVNFIPTRILHKEIVIKAISFDTPHLNLRQLENGTWNIQKIIEKKDSEKTTTTSQFIWRLNFKDVHIKGARIDLQFIEPSPFIPQHIDNIDFHLSIDYSNNNLNLKLWDFRLSTHHPPFSINNLSFTLFLKEKYIELNNLVLQTLKSQITGNAAISFLDKNFYWIKLKAFPFDISEIQQLFPEFFLHGTPSINFEAISRNDSLRINSILQQNEQRIKLQANLIEFSDNPQYHFEGEIEKVDLSYWLNDAKLTSLINGYFLIQGVGKEPDNTDFTFSSKFKNVKILETLIKDFSIQAKYTKGTIEGFANVLGEFGQVTMETKVNDVTNKQKFWLLTKLQDINIAKIAPHTKVQSNLKLNLIANGYGIKPDKLFSEFELKVSPSEINDISIDSLFAKGLINKGSFILDQIKLENSIGSLYASGHGDLKNNNSIDFTVNINNLTPLQSRFHLDSLGMQGLISGTLQGKLDSLLVNSKYNLSQIKFNNIYVDSLTGNFTLFNGKDSIKSNSSIQLTEGKYGNFNVKSVNMDVEFFKNFFHIDLSLNQQDSINCRVNAILKTDNLFILNIPMIEFNIKDQHWINSDKSMSITFGDEFYDFQNINLISNEQAIHLNGILNYKEQANLKLEISDLEIKPFIELLSISPQVYGNLNAKFFLAGTAESPFLKGNLLLSDGKVHDLLFKTLELDFNYGDELLFWNALFKLNEQLILNNNGHLPVKLSLMKRDTLIFNDRPIQINLKTDKFDVGVLKAISNKIQNPTGTVYCNLNMKNTLKNPRILGDLYVTNGSFEIPNYGINYRNLNIELILDSTHVHLRNLKLQSRDGIANLSGRADITRINNNIELKNMNLNMKTSNFVIASNKDFEIRIDSNLQLLGDLDQPKFGGTVNILRSRLYLPAFESSQNDETEKELPLLVAAQMEILPSIRPKQQRRQISSKYIDNLRGNLKINIPRNTWLRSSDMNIEIAGNLDLVKSGQYFELFGDIQIIRGNYNLYGKRFDVQKGSFTFEGGSKIDPQIELEVQYVFRGLDKEKKYLKLYITGHVNNPSLQFSLNDVEIEETDAISYILFGRKFDDLTYSEKSEMGQQPGSSASGTLKILITGQMVGRLTRTLQRNLNLDVIEFKGDKNWRNATIIIGKYITTDLFLSYLREFSIGHSNEIVPEQVSLEYEISKFLFLQATKGDQKTSGFDLIWKLEK